ncbi:MULTISPECIES: hypothetical protein [unclassified Pseudofrankia]|uniref:hypothetical protein n=1 Tax=unclassified Pseudofrankia TaxID=2994372 RepID=UPI0012FFCE6A|nr:MULTISPECIES: hypothetical protein [unclassified Pseudofrankia]MDT3442442.1 hypothetical protein [Pseudofrankia sp. BMG5.37]
MRVIVTLHRAADGRPHGDVQLDGDQDTHPFSGWMELLQLLEQAAAPAPPPGTAG